MGWASGSELAENLWDLVREFVPEDRRKKIAKKFIDEFESMDCDTICECTKLCKDAGRKSWDDEDFDIDKDYQEEDDE
jgi:hypothetical protein